MGGGQAPEESRGSRSDVTTIFLTGYAKLPDGITASEVYKVVGIGLEVERTTGTVVAADCTLATEVGRRFFRKLLEGRRLVEDFAVMVEEVELRYLGNAQKALVTAMRIARDKYKAYCANRN